MTRSLNSLQQVDVGVEEREELLADDDVVAQRADQLVEDHVDGPRALVEVVAPAEASGQTSGRLLALHDERRLEVRRRLDHGLATSGTTTRAGRRKAVVEAGGDLAVLYVYFVRRLATGVD